MLDQVTKGKLLPDQYPSTIPFDFKEKYQNIIVFIVGGATYEEAKDVATIYNT